MGDIFLILVEVRLSEKKKSNTYNNITGYCPRGGCGCWWGRLFSLFYICYKREGDVVMWFADSLAGQKRTRRKSLLPSGTF